MFLKAAFAVGLITALLGNSASSEVLIAPFNTPGGTPTENLYSGDVHLVVSGIGQAEGATFNDAFYVVTGGPTSGPNTWGGFYELAFSTAAGTALLPSNDVAGNLLGLLPAYDSVNHLYDVVLQTGAVSPTRLWFGVSDPGYGDNTGAFTIHLEENAVPEAGVLPIMLTVVFTYLTLKSMRRRRRPLGT